MKETMFSKKKSKKEHFFSKEKVYEYYEKLMFKEFLLDDLQEQVPFYVEAKEVPIDGGSIAYEFHFFETSFFKDNDIMKEAPFFTDFSLLHRETGVRVYCRKLKPFNHEPRKDKLEKRKVCLIITGTDLDEKL